VASGQLDLAIQDLRQFLGKGGTLNSITADSGVINTPEFAELVKEFSQNPTK
jgi:hypothetical protein